MIAASAAPSPGPIEGPPLVLPVAAPANNSVTSQTIASAMTSTMSMS
jgi:hypothetical protein